MTTRVDSPHNRWLVAGVGFALGLATVLTFLGVWRCQFVDYDDNIYVILNPHIAQGLCWPTVAWAFTFVDVAHWVPLTWLSYALDYQIYGLNPAGFHLTNLFLHTANAILLFFVLRRATGALWCSAFAAALFGVHPLRVESVAWVAERKDVLSGFFFMLTLWAYARYAQSPQSTVHSPQSEVRDQEPRAQRSNPEPTHETRNTEHASRLTPHAPHSTLLASRSTLHAPRSFYVLSLLFFALGLMSKSMLVTVPFLLLLLDYWPLKRLELTDGSELWPALKRLALEKTPFFVLMIGSSLITYLANGGDDTKMMMLPLGRRLANTVLATVAYLEQTFWPVKLAVFYPPKQALLLSVPTLAGVAFLLLATWAVLLRIKTQPFALAGWLWFLGMLVPVSGLVQVGEMIQADRYTYLPSIGIYILVVWGLAALVGARPNFRCAAASAGGVALAALAWTAHRQAAVWRNTETLFAHAVRVTSGNYQAFASLANVQLQQGHLDAALTNAALALQIAPRYPRAEYVLGAALQMQGRMSEALPHLLTAKEGPETMLPSRARLVLCYLDAGRLTEAAAALEEVFRTTSGPTALLMKAALLKEAGQTTQAKQCFAELIARHPKFTLDTPTLNFELAELYSLNGQNRQAADYYAKAIELYPQFTNALNNFAWILATDADSQVRDGTRAVELAERACRLTGWKQPLFMGTLAAAYAEAGRFDDAVKMAARARDQALADKLDTVAARNSELLELYRAHKAYHEPPSTGEPSPDLPYNPWQPTLHETLAQSDGSPQASVRSWTLEIRC